MIVDNRCRLSSQQAVGIALAEAFPFICQTFVAGRERKVLPLSSIHWSYMLRIAVISSNLMSFSFSEGRLLLVCDYYIL